MGNSRPRGESTPGSRWGDDLGGPEQRMLLEQGGGEDENTSRPYGFLVTL